MRRTLPRNQEDTKSSIWDIDICVSVIFKPLFSIVVIRETQFYIDLSNVAQNIGHFGKSSPIPASSVAIPVSTHPKSLQTSLSGVCTSWSRDTPMQHLPQGSQDRRGKAGTGWTIVKLAQTAWWKLYLSERRGYQDWSGRTLLMHGGDFNRT